MKLTKETKSNNKGFTLVELIVVIVILAILAAILVPALLGYIDRAKDSQYILNAKSVLTATQAEMSAIYGADKAPTEISNRLTTVVNTAGIPATATAKIGLKTAYDASNKTHDMYTVYYVYYEESGKYIVYNGTSWQTFSKQSDALSVVAATKTPITIQTGTAEE